MSWVQSIFYLGPISLLLVFFWLMKPRTPESGFRVREADLRKATRGLSSSSGKVSSISGSHDSLAEARMQKPSILALPGIRLDGLPHELLGVSPQASAAEIQKAYRELMKRYHPDKIGPQGSREWKDAQSIAEAINRAKDALMKNKGKS